MSAVSKPSFVNARNTVWDHSCVHVILASRKLACASVIRQGRTHVVGDDVFVAGRVLLPEYYTRSWKS